MQDERRLAALDFHVRAVKNAQALTPRFALRGAPEAPAREGRSDRAIPEDLRARIDRLAGGSAANKWLIYLLAIQALMARYADVDEALVATPPARSRADEAPLDTLLFVKASFSGATWKDLLGKLRREVEEAQLHRDYDHGALLRRLEALGCREEVVHDVILRHGAIHADSALLPAFRLRFESDASDRSIALVYRADILEPDLAERALGHLVRALDVITARPTGTLEDLDLLDEREKAQLPDWNAPAPAPPAHPSLVAAFEAQVRRAPGAVALSCGDERLTYAELDARANRLAHHLRALGVGPEVTVAICMDRTEEMVVSLLGVLKAGGAYLPLDPHYPRERLAFMIEDAQVAVIVAATVLLERLPETGVPIVDPGVARAELDAWPDVPLGVPLGPERAAYIIYTSGSTGQPKGVCVQHGNVLGLLSAADACFRFDASDVWTLFHSYAFDFSVWEIWGALLHGARLCVVPYWVTRSPGDFYQLLSREEVTVLNQTPSAFRQIVAWESQEGALPLALRYVIFGGEALEPAQLAPWIERHGDEAPQLINMYGITETTVHVTHYRVRAEDASASRSIIGKPIPGWRIHLLDRLGRLVPPGMPGEIYVGGMGVARGYQNRSELTAARFIDGAAAGLPGERLYRSGDRARLSWNGQLEYLGRIDHQVKIRGFRVEAGEIEAALERHPAVRRACIVARGDADKRLVAYIEKSSRDASTAREGAATDQIEQWREIYDQLYADGSAPRDGTFHIVGWNDSAARAPIHAEQMRAWVDGTVARIRGLAPRCVLEIGCGTGLLLFRVAPHVERYVATDFSRAALDHVARHLHEAGAPMDHVVLRHGKAHELEAILGDERFDLIVINSVVQYFPDQAYLERVLEEACARVTPGGFVFVGDVRDHTTLEAFHLGVCLAQEGGGLAPAEIDRRLRRRLASEEELTIDPAFFLDLPRRIPRITDVRPLVKRGGYDNELMRFRYDVVLRVEGPPQRTAAVWDWQREGLLRDVVARRLAAEQPELLVIDNIPNRHVAGLFAALSALREGRAASAEELSALARDGERAAPEDLRELEGELPYRIELVVGTEPGRLRACLRRGEGEGGALPEGQGPPVHQSPRHRGPSYTNTPLAQGLDGLLVQALRAQLKRSLPDYMIPATFAFLPALPTLPNGKIDRAALPEPDPVRRGGASYVAPRSDRERALAAVWQDALGVDRVGIHDHFFELGGDSIRGIRVVHRARSAGITLTVLDIFSRPTVAELAALAEERLDEEAAPIDAPFALLGEGDRAAMPPRVVDAYPLTRLQAGMVFHTLFGKEDALYHDILSFDLEMPWDGTALRAALAGQMDRHPVLRTSFDVRTFSEGMQLVHDGVEPPLTIVDARALSPAEQDTILDRLFEDEKARGFDLDSPPLFRVHVLRRSDDRIAFTLSFHHGILDGWSAATLLTDLLRDVTAAAAGAAPSLAQGCRFAYRDYVALERSAVEQPSTRRYWAARLAGAEPLRIPRRPGKTLATSALVVREIVVSDPDSEALASLADMAGAPLKHVLLAAHAKVLSMITGRSDLPLGVVHNGRLEVEGGDRMLGLFLNTPILRVKLEPGSFVDLARQLAREDRDLLPHRRFPLAEIHAILGERSAFDVYFNYTHFHVFGDVAAELGIVATGSRSFSRTNFPLGLIVEKHPQRAGIKLLLKYDAAIYPAAQIDELAGAYRAVLDVMIRRPADRHERFHVFAGAAERHLARFRAPIARRVEQTVVDDIERQASERPAAVAIEHPGGSLSYGDLAARVDSMTRALRALGVGRDVLVGVALGGGLRQVLAMLATFRAGGVYVPLRLDEPLLRWQRMTRKAPPALLVVPAGEADDIAARVEHLAERPVVVLTSDDGFVSLREPDGHGYREAPLPAPEGGSRAATYRSVEGSAPSPAPPLARPHVDQANYIFFTSGSTGEPKAILGSHGSIRQFVRWEIDEFGLGEACRCAQVAHVQFDAYLRETLVSLCAGGTLVIPDEGTRGDIERLLIWLGARRINLIHTVPSVMRLLVGAGAHVPVGVLAPLERYVMGGEPLSAQDIASFRRRFGAHVELVNIYGTTETTCIKTFHRIGDLDGLFSQRIPAGEPMAEAAMAVIDGKRACLPGEIGEIFLKSPYMTLGYYKDPAIAARVFVQNPLVDFPDIVYHTGDLGRFLPDGTLEVLGRGDDQIKRNGIRIELGEIEEALRAQPGVYQALVTADKLAGGAVVITGYFTGPEAQDREALRGGLGRALPGYMLPNHLVRLEAFPLLPNGKVDRAALPRPDAELGGEHRRAPRDEWEALLGNAFSEVLGLQGRALAYDVPFFELGGNSLLAMQLVSRIHRTFGVSLPLRDLFAHPTVEELARQVARRRPIAAEPIPALPEAAHHAVSKAQRRLWILHHIDEEATGYHIREAFFLRGPVDPSALARAFARLTERHEILRTTFAAIGGEPRQVVHPADAAQSPRLEYRDWRAAPPSAEALSAEIWRLVGAPFDLAAGPLVRASLLHLADQELVLVNVMHHIVTDAWSIGVMRRELIALYREEVGEGQAALPSLSIQYKDYAAWQDAWLRSAAAAPARAYWTERFRAPVSPLDLPTDRPRGVSTPARGATRREHIDRAAAERLRDLGQRHGATLFMTLLAVFEVLLNRYTGQTDITVGAPSSGRTHADLEGQLGFYVNTLALRTRLDPARSFEDALRAVAKTCLEAYEHRDYPFDRLVEEVSVERDLARHPLFDVMFALTTEERGAEGFLPGVAVEPHPLPPRDAQLDLSIHAIEQADGLQVIIDYNPALFEDERIARLWRHYRALLGDALDHPTRPLAALNLLPPEELAEIHERARPCDEDLIPAEDLITCVSRQAAARPDAIAVRHRDRTLTYRELDDLTGRLAARLSRHHGVGPERFVALYMDRSIELIAVQMAVLRAGGAFVPIDTGLPAERVAFVVADAGCCLFLHDRTDPPDIGIRAPIVDAPGLFRAASESSDVFAASPSSPAQAAYAIYTSGSTGAPKGAVIGRQSFSNLCACHARFVRLGPESKVTYSNSIGFDTSLIESWPTLTSGGCVVVLPDGAWNDLHALVKLANETGVTHLEVPSVVCELLAGEDAPMLDPRIMLTTGGDNLRQADTKRRHVINAYGTTETTADNIMIDLYGLDTRDGIPIGKPMNGTRVYLLDEAQRPVPVGLPGEVYLSGPSLARGYLNRPALTAQRFIPSSFHPAERMYRTGDRARFRLSDGHLEFLGRVDRQVQIRGYRVEIGEVEAGLLRHEAVREACVVVAQDGDGRPKLIAYVVTSSALPEGELRGYLGGFLPHYMVPARIVRIERFPLNVNGKRDLARLPRPDEGTPRAVEPPATKTEAAMAAIWRTVLDLPAVSVTESFFHQGGYSLKAMSLVALVERDLGVAIPLSLVYEKQTVRELSAYVDQAREMRLETEQHPYVRLGGEHPRALFLFPPALGFAAAYARLAEHMPGVSLYAFNNITDDATLARHAGLIEELSPEGPLVLLGHSAGGFLALLMARELEARGRRVSDIILLDTFRGGREEKRASVEEIRAGVDEFVKNPRRAELRAYFLKNRQLRERTYRQVQAYFEFLWSSDLDVHVNATIHLLRAEENHHTPDDWPRATTGTRVDHIARGAHRDMLEPPHLAYNAVIIGRILSRSHPSEEHIR